MTPESLLAEQEEPPPARDALRQGNHGMWIKLGTLSTALVVCCAQASESISYSYDALGRLTNVRVAGGPANGVQRSYTYDATDNRTLLQVSGAAGTASVTITAQAAVANETSDGVAIGVTINGSPPPTGEVTFTENGVFLGSAFIYSGQATVILESFPAGTHTIVASYLGDGANAPYSFTFKIKVQNLLWAPAVLQILLSN